MLTFSPARQKFWQIARMSDAVLGIPELVEGALAIAWEEYPRIDLGHYRELLQQMGEELGNRVANIPYPMRIVSEMSRYLAEECRFRGNDTNYYDPRNSFLNDVLDRRLGIPIALSLVYMYLGHYIGFPIEGVSLPGHFIVRPTHPDLQVFIDPFNQGEVLFDQDCALRMSQVYGKSVSLRPEYLEPVSVRRILERMLMNLKMIYLQQGDLSKALAAVERILILVPESPLQWRDRGLICFQLESFTEARADLETYLTKQPNATDARAIAKLIAEIDLKV